MKKLVMELEKKLEKRLVRTERRRPQGPEKEWPWPGNGLGTTRHHRRPDE
ncbi:hypothetical protein ACIG0D_09475 [Streptomyces sp. NPDC052773]